MDTIELFAVQPYMTLNDYVGEDAFYRKIEGFFVAADRMRSNSSLPALIAFPEDLASFLALAGRGRLIAKAKSLEEVFGLIAKKFWPDLLRAMAHSRTLSLREAFFALAAPEIWRIWHRTMSHLARRFAMTTVAGSALLPENRLGYDQEAFRAAGRAVYNLSVTYGPDGRFLSMTRKVNLVPGHEDALSLTPGPIGQAVSAVLMPETTSVKIATAICYDSFVTAHTSSEPTFQSLWPLLDAKGTKLAIVPSANPWPWNDPWPLDQTSPPRLRRQQWAEESLPSALMPRRSVLAALNPHLLASLLDLHFDGQSAIWAKRDGQVECLAAAPAALAVKESECVVHALWKA